MKTKKNQREAVVLHRLVRWFCCNVAFVSWHKHWKGIYLHFFPCYCVRIFLWGVDWHRKNPLIYSPNSRMASVDVPDISPEAEARRKKIIELAGTMNWVDNDGQVEIDSDARLSEGDDNGCYVSAWVWCDFAKSEFDKQCDECMEVQESPEDLTRVDGNTILCAECHAQYVEDNKEEDDED